MKNKVILIVAMLLLFATVASGSSINGEYKGYPIINVKIDNKTISPLDVPAINFEGTTLVPIRLVSENMGAEITWREDTQTVYIGSNLHRIRFMKIHHQLSNIYYELIMIGESLKTVYKDIILGYSISINSKQISAQYLKNTNDSIKEIKERLNNVLHLKSEIDLLTENTAVNTNNIQQIIDNYNFAIENYQLSIISLGKHLLNSKQDDFDDSKNYAEKSYNISKDSIELSVIEKNISDDYIMSSK